MGAPLSRKQKIEALRLTYQQKQALVGDCAIEALYSFADEIEGEEDVYALPSWCDSSTKDVRAKIVSQRSHNLQNGWECAQRDQKQFAEAEAAAAEAEAAAEPEAAEPKAAAEKPKRQKKKIVIEEVDSDDDNEPSSAEACTALLPPREQLEQLDSALGNSDVNYIELLKGVLQSKEIQQAACELTQSLEGFQASENHMEGFNKNSQSTTSTETHEIGTKRPRFVSRKFMSRHGEFPKKEPEPEAAHTLDENLDTLD